MMRKQWIWLAVMALLCLSAATRAPMTGLSPFKKPNIADIFKPVVGNGTVYETRRTDQRDASKQPLEMTVVGKESFEGKEAYWLEFAHTEAGSGSLGYAKMLMAKDDFQPHRVIAQQPGTAGDGICPSCRHARKDTKVKGRRDGKVAPWRFREYHRARRHVFLPAPEEG
jgi:hypothetical protein